tara:strand:- start:161 stop:415 length:255 start_codon:yes stop_codon:yes gene_type:complete
MVSLKEELKEIKSRNKRVEGAKAWETSTFRRVTIALMTYLIAVIFLWIIEVPNFWLNALVPTGGFVLSTLSLPFIKNWWIRKKY